ncbi:hypothetical protein ACIRJS_21480 [Streptomyces sp. NPDC102340]|uniref:hypothetical protein n=1 Tax=unclassified Streptomyces TaxID=2593676 RepID=UPI00381B5111
MLKAEHHDWDCPTCDGSRRFRQLKPHEETRLAELGHSPADINRTYRCSITSCLSIRRHLSPWKGRLPDDIDD